MSISAFLDDSLNSGGLIRIEPDPQVEIAAPREVVSSYEGKACPDKPPLSSSSFSKPRS